MQEPVFCLVQGVTTEPAEGNTSTSEYLWRFGSHAWTPKSPIFARKSKSNNTNTIVVSSSQGLEGFDNITLSWERLNKLNIRFLAME